MEVKLLWPSYLICRTNNKARRYLEMQKENRTLKEMRQLLNMVVRTFVNIYGMNPSADDLYQRLGLDYTPLIEEYSCCQAA